MKVPNFGERLQHAWNAFRGRDHPKENYDYGTYYRPDRYRLNYRNEKTLVTSIYNRIAIDVSSINIYHAYLDQNDRFVSTVKSHLNDVLNVEANLDQTGRQFIQDLVISMFDEGCVASVPIDTTLNPSTSGSFDIKTMRVGKIVQWYPDSVKVQVYNEKTGRKEELKLLKKFVGIHENPLYAIMNEPNSTMQRLARKLALLDTIDERNGSGKLEMLLKLPYSLRNDSRIAEAEKRTSTIERQLEKSKYGIAYIDSTEQVTQLNRPIENNLLSQIEYLTNQLFAQLGITAEILNGTADEQAMLNYYNRTVEPVLSSITDEYNRKFLTKTARTHGQAIVYIRDPFRLIPINNIADIADKFTRNEILSSNEIRGIIGFKPSDDPKADELRNKNIAQPEEEIIREPVDANQNEIDEEPDYDPTMYDPYQDMLAEDESY